MNSCHVDSSITGLTPTDYFRMLSAFPSHSAIMRTMLSRWIPAPIKRMLRAVWAALRSGCVPAPGANDPLIPPGSLRAPGDGDYIAIGEEFFRFFLDIGGLKPDEKVLDVGCGTGRMARPLARYLAGGSYDGIDIVASSIRWCRKAYGRRHPAFRFHLADIFSKDYNPSGRKQAADYRFPFEDAAFDFVVLTSVFTHMLPPDVQHYFSEIARVLKPGGRCFITYFLINDESSRLIESGASRVRFRHARPGCRVERDDIPESAVAYPEADVRQLYDRNGLRIAEPIRYGAWCGRNHWLSYQDIILATKCR